MRRDRRVEQPLAAPLHRVRRLLGAVDDVEDVPRVLRVRIEKFPASVTP